MKDAIDAGKLGKPVLAIVTMLAGRNRPTTFLIHGAELGKAREGGGLL